MVGSRTAQTAPLLALSIADFCRSVGIGTTTFYKLLKADKIKTIKIGTRILIPMEEARRIANEGIEV